jgi:hypothetical protein
VPVPVPAYLEAGDEHSTQLLSTVPEQDLEPAPPPPAGADRRSRRRPVLPLVVGACGLLLVLMIGLLLLNNDGDDGGAGAADRQSRSPSPSQTQPARPDAESIESFATDYLTTAADDPQAGYAMLTPEFQAESGGLPGYEGFWGRVSNVRIDDVQADVAALTVTYTYTYDLAASGVQTDTVELQLVQGEAGGYLIAEDLTLD